MDKKVQALFIKLACLFGLSLLLPACVMTNLTEVDADPNFKWDSLKRDEIVMTPLLDLRGLHKPPAALQFFSGSEQQDYAQKFKQEFNYMRKDIRLFGQGGAFESLAALEQLPDLAAQILSKKPLSPEAARIIRERNQDIRFLFVFAFVGESLTHTVDYTYIETAELDSLTYTSRRVMTVKMALWDSVENKTQWIGTKVLSPASAQAFPVYNPSKHLEKVKADNPQGYELKWVGTPLSISLAQEERLHANRFPATPGREPGLSGSFRDFALGFPIHPSEEKLIAYDWFSYHRPQARAGVAGFGSALAGTFQLGTSSIWQNRYRLGADVLYQGAFSSVGYAGREYNITAGGFGLSADLEWELTQCLRLLTGVQVGAYGYNIKDKRPWSVAVNSSGEKTISDTAGGTFAAPRVQLLFGAQSGFQWGLGAAFRASDVGSHPVLRAQRPSPWQFDASVAYAFRGF